MGYMHIENLYKNQEILLFKECYAMEKIHGTSAHIKWNQGNLTFFSGGEKNARFVALFNIQELEAKFQEMGHETVTVFGEAYGGGQQKQAHRYGDKLKFIVFDVLIGDLFLSVPLAEKFVNNIGLEFVFYRKVSTDLASLDAERDAPSEQAKRNGIQEEQTREGVVLRPLMELTKNDGGRICSKHKRDDFRETASPRVIDDVAKLKILTEANEIALEWVTPMRLIHVLDKLGGVDTFTDMRRAGDVIKAMNEDILREAAGEIVDNSEVWKIVSKRTAEMLKAHCQTQLKTNNS